MCNCGIARSMKRSCRKWKFFWLNSWPWISLLFSITFAFVTISWAVQLTMLLLQPHIHCNVDVEEMTRGLPKYWCSRCSKWWCSRHVKDVQNVQNVVIQEMVIRFSLGSQVWRCTENVYWKWMTILIIMTNIVLSKYHDNIINKYWHCRCSSRRKGLGCMIRPITGLTL